MKSISNLPLVRKFFSPIKKSSRHAPINLVLFPGIGGTGKLVFSRVIAELEKSLPHKKFNIHYVPTLGDSFEKITDDCTKELLDSIKEEPIFGAGHSLGAVTAATVFVNKDVALNI